MTTTPSAYKSISRLVLVALAIVACAAHAHAQDAAGQPSTDTLLADARRLYAQMDKQDALAALDQAIPQLQLRQGEAEVRTQLSGAFLLRARVLNSVGDSASRARMQADLESLLRLEPAYRLPTDVPIAPKVVEKFGEVRKAIVGELVLNIQPEDADVELDGKPLIGTRTIALVSGPHTVSVRRVGYAPQSGLPVTVAAGALQPFALTLERTSATLSFVTVPAGVAVSVNGQARGVTVEGASAGAPSQKMILQDLMRESFTLDFTKACFVPERVPVAIDRFADLALPSPVKLKPATGTLTIGSPSVGATILIDDTERGRTPAVVTECEGRDKKVEVRAPFGRLIRRVNVRTGDQQKIEGELKPAFALLSTSGLEEGYRGGEDLRVRVEQTLASASAVTLFAPRADQAQKALQDEQLKPGWLAFDRLGRTKSDEAKKIAPAARRELSQKLSQAFQAQGIASVTVTGTENNTLLVSLLADGSAEPDVIEVQLDSAESATRAIAALDVSLPLFTPSIGLLAIDVSGPQAPVTVIARVDRTGGAAFAGLGPGDVIVSANGRPVTSAEALNDALKTLPAGTALSLEVRQAAGAVKKVDLRPVPSPRAVAVEDQTILFNPLLLHLRRSLESASAADRPVLMLNQGIALMRLGNWDAARTALQTVQLANTTGVSNGTVQYLLGECFEALRRFDEARTAFSAAKASDALLTEDGPPVKDLAEKRLANLGRAGSER